MATIESRKSSSDYSIQMGALLVSQCQLPCETNNPLIWLPQFYCFYAYIWLVELTNLTLDYGLYQRTLRSHPSDQTKCLSAQVRPNQVPFCTSCHRAMTCDITDSRDSHPSTGHMNLKLFIT